MNMVHEMAILQQRLMELYHSIDDTRHWMKNVDGQMRSLEERMTEVSEINFTLQPEQQGGCLPKHFHPELA